MNHCEIGDCREIMRRWVSEGVKVQMCVTSPPYWGLRDYGVAGQLGLERTPQEYVENMVEVIRLVRELLADDGTLWLNLGDSYWGGGRGGNPEESAFRKQATNRGSLIGAPNWAQMDCGLKPKDLVGIPWRVAFALQADGWWLRSDIIWHKPSCMPESVTDRPTRSHEYLFLLAKAERYYYDADAIREPLARSTLRQIEQGYEGKARKDYEAVGVQNPSSVKARIIANRQATPARARPASAEGRNARTVWSVNSANYSEAHFATFPPALIEPCILAGSKPGDVVLDPFMGSGTTGQAAQDLGRKWLGCELNPKYAELQDRSTAQQGMILA